MNLPLTPVRVRVNVLFCDNFFDNEIIREKSSRFVSLTVFADFAKKNNNFKSNALTFLAWYVVVLGASIALIILDH